MGSNYPFLGRNQKTEQDRQRENIESLWSQLGSIGVSNGKSFFTGNGEDGQLQPERPTNIMNTSEGPRTVHEGEQVDIGPDGGFSVTPASQVGGQDELASMEKERGIKGYQFGTDDKQENTVIPESTFRPYQTRGLQRLESYATGESPMDKSIREGVRERFAGEAASAKGAMSQELAQSDITGREAAIEQSMLNRQIGSQESQVMASLREQQSARGFSAAQALPGAATAAAGEERVGRQFQESLAFDREKYGDQEVQRMAEDAQTLSINSWLTKYPEARASDYYTAREYKTLQLKGMGVDIASGEESLSQLKTEGEIRIGNQFLAAKDYSGYAAFMKSKGIDIDPAQYEKDLVYHNTTQGQDADARDIANAAAEHGLNATRLADGINAINSGAMLNTVNEMLGTDFNGFEFSAIARDYVNKSAMDKIVLDEARTTYGNEKADAIIDRINKGYSLDQINTEFPDANIGVEDFTAMRSASEIGERDWAKKMSAVPMLLETNDPGNIAQAESILGELLPGVQFDFGSMISDVGADNFAEGMTALSTLAQTFSSWDEAVGSVAGLDIISDMGMLSNQELFDAYGKNKMASILKRVVTDESRESINDALGIDLSETDYSDLRTAAYNAKTMFEGLQFNTIDEEWDVIVESDFYKNLETEEQDLIHSFLVNNMTGELEFDRKPVYNVVDTDGRLAKSFGSIADANTYLAENPDAEYSIEEDENMVYKNLLTGDSVVINNDGSVAGVGDKGTDTVESAWDTFNNSQLGLPENRQVDYDVWKVAWEEEGSPKGYTFNDFDKVATPISALKSIEIEEYSELLTKDNSEKLLTAFKEEPINVRKSEFYYDIPDFEYIKGAIDGSVSRGGKRSVSVSNELESNLNNSVGKYVEIPIWDRDSKTTNMYNGQIESWEKTPSTVQITLNKEDGTKEKVVIFEVSPNSGNDGVGAKFWFGSAGIEETIPTKPNVESEPYSKFSNVI